MERNQAAWPGKSFAHGWSCQNQWGFYSDVNNIRIYDSGQSYSLHYNRSIDCTRNVHLDVKTMVYTCLPSHSATSYTVWSAVASVTSAGSRRLLCCQVTFHGRRPTAVLQCGLAQLADNRPLPNLRDEFPNTGAFFWCLPLWLSMLWTELGQEIQWPEYRAANL